MQKPSVRTLTPNIVAYEGRGPVAASLRHIKRSPLLVGSMADLPPAVFLICGKDPLCDEGIVYSKRLAEAIGEDKVKLHMSVEYWIPYERGLY